MCIIVCLFTMVCLTAAGAFAYTSAGTDIVNTATCTYNDPEGLEYRVTASVTVQVAQVCGILIIPDGSEASPGQTFTGAPGKRVHLPYTVINAGNGPDAFYLYPENLNPDSRAAEIRLYLDVNGNGRADPGEPLYDNANPRTLAEGGHMAVVITVLISEDAAPGDLFINLSGETACVPAQTDDDNVSRITVVASDRGYVTADKSADKTSVQPGDALTYRIDFTNEGAGPVIGVDILIDTDNDGRPERFSGMLVSDDLPAPVSFVDGSAVYALDGRADAFAVYASEDGVWKTDPSVVGGGIAMVGLFIPADAGNQALSAGESGFFSFSVVIDADADGQGLANQAQVSGDTDVDSDTVYVDIEPDDGDGCLHEFLVRVEIETPAARRTRSSGDWGEIQPLSEHPVIVFAYDAQGNPAGQKEFFTDADGYILLDENEDPYEISDWLRDDLVYRVGLPDPYGDFTYYLSPLFYKSDPYEVNELGGIYQRGEITAMYPDQCSRTLILPLDPAGYVYDGATGEPIDGACVSLYRCETESCDAFELVSAASLGVYSDGVTPQENPQTTGPSNSSGAAADIGAGVFELNFGDIGDIVPGWYFVTADFDCDAAGADADLADKYSAVAPNPDQVWTPGSGAPYQGEKFYIDDRIIGAFAMPIPLTPGDYRELSLSKTVSPSAVGIGDLLKFTLTVRNDNQTYPLYDATLYDDMPPVLRYVDGTTRLEDEPVDDPAISEDGVRLAWDIGDLSPGQEKTLTFYARVITGEGSYINASYSFGWSSADHLLQIPSNQAEAPFRIERELFTENGVIVGRVYVDANDNKVHDENEPGVKNVKIYTTDGRYVVTDDEGKYHFDNVRPGTHVLKIDPVTLPENGVLAIVNNRNMDDPNSAFVDLFPGDLMKVNFRLKASPKIDYTQDWEALEKRRKLRVRRKIDAFVTEAGSGGANIRHTLTIKNTGETPLYELKYEEASPFAPLRGTVYLNDAPFYDPEKEENGGASWTFPMLAPGREIALRYLSEIPEDMGEASGRLTFYRKPAGEPVHLPVDIPMIVNMMRQKEYAVTVYFKFASHALTDAAKASLDALATHLRKTDFNALYIDIKGHADAIRVDPARTDYKSNLELSQKRAQAVRDYLKERLIDVRRLKDAPERRSEKRVATYLEKLADEAGEEGGKSPAFSIRIGQFDTKKQAEKEREKREAEGIDAFIREKVIMFQKYYLLYAGRFDTAEEAEAHRSAHFPDQYAVEPLTRIDIERTKEKDAVFMMRQEARGSLDPAVINKTDADGTPENRRVEVRVYPLGASVTGEKETAYGDVLRQSLYRLQMTVEFGYPLDYLYDPQIFIRLPDAFRYLNGSAAMDGRKADMARKGDFFVLSADKIRADRPVSLTLRFLPAKRVSMGPIPLVALAKTEGGKVVTAFNISDEALFKDVQRLYLGGNPTPAALSHADVDALKKTVRYGVLYPEQDGIQAGAVSRIKIGVPVGASYEVTLNGAALSENAVGEKATDEALNIQTVEYIGVRLKEGENTIALKAGDIDEVRKITITGDADDIRWRIYPEKPPADGKTPAYVILSLTDAEGRVIRENAHIEGRVDKGDIYDQETDEYKRFTDDGFTVRTVAGEATVKLSPAAVTEERTLTVTYGDIEKTIDVQFFPEQRPWLITGLLEGAAGYSDRKNDPSEFSDMPFRHDEEGFHAHGRSAVFGKGTVKDYTVTFRYDTKKTAPENTLMEQNAPSTEEDSYYPVYGDESEPFYEAKSKERLFFKIEKDLSYLMYGDYNTELGREFEFNTYDRTLNGVLFNAENSDRARLKGFYSENNQSVVRDRMEGRGISGPYFFTNDDLVVYSEKVTIEVRSRYNPNIIVDSQAKNRFTDYTINYDDGYIIFHEPVPGFDDELNPVFIEVVYETENLKEDNRMYGLRGEYDFFDGRLTFGAMGTLEEHPETDRKIYGVDVLYDDEKRLKVVGEMAWSENFEETEFEETRGEAARFEAAYKIGKGSEIKAGYKKVNDGFQNLSSSTADAGYETYGVSGEARFNEDNTVIKGDITADNDDAVDRVKAESTVEQKVLPSLRVVGGARWNREERIDETEEDIQAIAGVKFNPTERLGVSVQRDQSLTGETGSEMYPTKTAGRISYRLTDHIETYLQTEIREEADADTALTSIGLDSTIGENTTAFSKYTIDDSVSGWRNQSHVGVNHQFIVTDDLTFDAGMENVTTLSGDDADDYTAPRLSFTYLQKDQYKLTGKSELRFNGSDVESLFSLGGTVRVKDDYTLFAKGRYFDSDYVEKNLLLGVARRPAAADRLNYLAKFRWKQKDENEIEETKYIGSWHVNCQMFQPVTLMGEYAFKYAEVEGVDDSYTDLIRGRIIWDVTDRFDVGFHAGVLHQYDTGTYTLSWGPEVGVRVIENLWVSVGYNFNGFYDDDFDDANAWEKGFYAKIRLKFDENSLKKLFGKLKKSNK